MCETKLTMKERRIASVNPQVFVGQHMVSVTHMYKYHFLTSVIT